MWIQECNEQQLCCGRLPVTLTALAVVFFSAMKEESVCVWGGGYAWLTCLQIFNLLYTAGVYLSKETEERKG